MSRTIGVDLDGCDLQKLRGKVAVITGAASGIGRAFASRCASEGMKLVLADVEREALAVTGAEMRARGASILGVQADVSNADDVERLAQKTLDRFGAVHLLFNNAGVGVVGPNVWESTRADVEWVLGVNLRGVLHGLRVFVPIMLEQATEGHIVNTASAAGLVATPGIGLYSASKAGIVALSEALHHELALLGATIKVSVVCPGAVRTRMVDASRNRPAALQNDPELEADRRAKHQLKEQEVRETLEAAMSPEELAEQVIDAVRSERFYVFTHLWVKQALQLRMENILERRDPWKGSGYKEPSA